MKEVKKKREPEYLFLETETQTNLKKNKILFWEGEAFPTDTHQKVKTLIDEKHSEDKE
jgi:hypothetical protein